MSLVKSLANLGRSILGNKAVTSIASVIPGIGTGIAVAGGLYQAYQGAKSATSLPGDFGSMGALPPMGSSTTMGMAGLSPATVGRGAAYVVKGARAIPRAAVALCRKYPTWCSTIGGTVAVEALFNSGQLPVPKRRRGRGISAHELKAFKRVARFTHKYCAPVHHAMKSPALRRHKGASCQ